MRPCSNGTPFTRLACIPMVRLHEPHWKSNLNAAPACEMITQMSPEALKGYLSSLKSQCEASEPQPEITE